MKAKDCDEFDIGGTLADVSHRLRFIEKTSEAMG
jgi:hypothetical protein